MLKFQFACFECAVQTNKAVASNTIISDGSTFYKHVLFVLCSVKINFCWPSVHIMIINWQTLVSAEYGYPKGSPNTNS
jgi:hypothetical protein